MADVGARGRTVPGRAGWVLDALRRTVAEAGPAVTSGVRLLRSAVNRGLRWSRNGAGGAREDSAATQGVSAASLSTDPRALSVAAGTLAAGAAAAGVSRPRLYRDERSVVAMLRGYDAVTLAVGVPVLAGAVRAASRGSPGGQLVLGGVLAYLVYAYAVFVFGTAFNPVFLAHVAIFGLSLAALVQLLRRLDVSAIGRLMRPSTPVRPVAGVLGLLGATLGGMWTYYSLRFAWTGARPAESKLVLPLPAVRLGYVLDLLLVAPEYVVAARLLWRRAPWGYVAATVLLTSGALLQLQYMAALLFQTAARVPGATPVDPLEPFIALGMAGGAATLLAGLRARSAGPSSTSQPTAA